MIHRDIKSENVLLFQTEERLVAKLADFGFLLFPQHEQTVCGTIGFMAPEMVKKTPTTFPVFSCHLFFCLVATQKIWSRN